MKGGIAVNDAQANLLCALQGLGLAHLALAVVLPGPRPTPMPVSLLYARGRIANPRLQAFASWIAGIFATDPGLCLAHD